MSGYFLNIFYALLLLHASSGFNEGKCIESERLALLNFIADLSDPSGMLTTWRKDENNADCCKWKGITCNYQTGYVLMLNLRGDFHTHLRGPINISLLLNLPNMEYLDLSNNDFSYSLIPKSIGSFTNLKYLNLSYSGFSGMIPSELGNLSQLRFLDLGRNRLKGAIPFQIGNLRQLQYLDLRGYYSGEIPFGIGNLSVLHTLKLGGNFDAKNKGAEWLSTLHFLTTLDFSSYGDSNFCHDRLQTIRKLIPNFRELRLRNCGLLDHDISSLFHSRFNFSFTLAILDLSDNMLTSSIFQSIFNFSHNLQELYLSNNNIALSSPVYLNLSSLAILDLSGNMLTSSIFQSFSNFSHNLQELYLSNNNIALSSPVYLNLSSLAILDLSHNMLTSSIFQSFSNVSHNLQELYLSNNNIALSSPVYLNLSSLAILDLSDNMLTSSIFQSFSNFSHNLQELYLSDNNIDLSSPVYLNLSSLVILDLSDNMLTSSIFQSFSNFSHNLQELDLSYNNIALSSTMYPNFPSSLMILDLSYNNITPSIFQGNFSFSKLQELYLTNCSLTDNSFLVSSASSIFNPSSSLVILHLSDNLLISSAIFHWLFNFTSTLHWLDLSYNLLEGPIPDEFSKAISSLEVLDLRGNKLCEIPTSFGEMCTLQSLDLSHNKLSGEISNFFQNSSWCNRHIFQSLDLSYNRIAGRIPKSIGMLSELEYLYLEGNSLEGDVTELHLTNFSKLESLYLSYNSLSLNIVSSWVPPFQLTRLGLASCKLGPTFPGWLQTQSRLYTLDISDAGLNDSVPEWFWNNLTHMERLNMSHNNLIGAIPNLPAKLFSRPVIFLNSNQFEGRVPSFLLQASELKLSGNKFSDSLSFLCDNRVISDLAILDLSNNKIKGQLPNCWDSMSSLLFLDLKNNNLSGKIPRSIGNLVELEALVLRDNSLTGELPSTLQNCSNLILLDVSENLLSGPIPSWIGESMQHLKILMMRGNQFSGNIPIHLCYLKRIQLLDISRNHLSNEIPTCLNNFTSMSEKSINSSETSREIYWYNTTYSEIYGRFSFGGDYTFNITLMWKGAEYGFKNPEFRLKSIDLSSNSLTGKIPKEIGYLLGLVSLNLSRNNLSGEIPSEIGNLSSLEFVDLSRNHFSGKVPSTLSKIDRLAVLDLSYNFLSGKIPLGTQLQTFDASRFEGNVGLCGRPLDITCPEDQKPVKPPEPAVHGEDDNSLFQEALYMSLGLGYFTGFWGLIGPILFWQPWRQAYIRFLNRFIDYIYVMSVVNAAKFHSWLKAGSSRDNFI